MLDKKEDPGGGNWSIRRGNEYATMWGGGGIP